MTEGIEGGIRKVEKIEFGIRNAECGKKAKESGMEYSSR
jgi:hypothetical protein